MQSSKRSESDWQGLVSEVSGRRRRGPNRCWSICRQRPSAACCCSGSCLFKLNRAAHPRDPLVYGKYSRFFKTSCSIRQYIGAYLPTLRSTLVALMLRYNPPVGPK